jgi:hypothetical protein
MLDDVERGTFLVEPAREDPAPILVRPLHVDLDEGARQLLAFPRRRRLAGAQADDDVLDADRLPRLQSQILDDAVALVEQAEHGDALGHRRHARLVGGRLGNLDGDGIAFRRLVIALAAAGKRGQPGQQECRPLHYSPGVQAL